MDSKREEQEKANNEGKSSKKTSKKRTDDNGFTIYDDGNSDDDKSDDEDVFTKAKKKYLLEEKKKKKFKNLARTNEDGEALGELGDDDEAGEEIEYGSDASSIFEEDDRERDAPGIGENTKKTKVQIGGNSDDDLGLSDSDQSIASWEDSD